MDDRFETFKSTDPDGPPSPERAMAEEEAAEAYGEMYGVPSPLGERRAGSTKVATKKKEEAGGAPPDAPGFDDDDGNGGDAAAPPTSEKKKGKKKKSSSKGEKQATTTEPDAEGLSDQEHACARMHGCMLVWACSMLVWGEQARGSSPQDCS
jgi:hypothetical protein